MLTVSLALIICCLIGVCSNWFVLLENDERYTLWNYINVLKASKGNATFDSARIDQALVETRTVASFAVLGLIFAFFSFFYLLSLGFARAPQRSNNWTMMGFFGSVFVFTTLAWTVYAARFRSSCRRPDCIFSAGWNFEVSASFIALIGTLVSVPYWPKPTKSRM